MNTNKSQRTDAESLKAEGEDLINIIHKHMLNITHKEKLFQDRYNMHIDLSAEHHR